jgi:CheY-like chemotaxis protein
MAKVLVIDDDAAMRGLICQFLAGRGHEGVEAANGMEGMVALAHTRFDLVICDMLMPVQDGIETIQQIRELEAKIPIIAISGARGGDNFSPLDDAMALGADRSVKKPFTVGQLMAAVDDVLDSNQA